MTTHENPAARRQRQDLISAVMTILRAAEGGDTDRDLVAAVALVVEQALSDGLTDAHEMAEIVREATRDAAADEAWDARRAR